MLPVGLGLRFVPPLQSGIDIIGPIPTVALRSTVGYFHTLPPGAFFAGGGLLLPSKTSIRFATGSAHGDDDGSGGDEKAADEGWRG